MQALFTVIAALAKSDADLIAFFPGSGTHGWRPKDKGEFRRYFTFRSTGKPPEGAVSTADNDANKTTEDTVTVRFQCWADNDTDAMVGQSLLRKKYMRLARDLSSTDKLLQTEKGPEDLLQDPPDDDGNRLWQGVLDIVYHVQTKPYA